MMVHSTVSSGKHSSTEKNVLNNNCIVLEVELL